MSSSHSTHLQVWCLPWKTVPSLLGSPARTETVRLRNLLCHQSFEIPSSNAVTTEASGLLWNGSCPSKTSCSSP